MESTITTSVNNSWEVVPSNTIASLVLFALFFYLFFRHALFVFMLLDILIGWLRKYDWFPKEGKRKKTLIHWLIAVGLLIAFLIIAGSAGWLKFIPQ